MSNGAYDDDDDDERQVLRWHSFTSPVGEVHLAATESGVCRVAWRVMDAKIFEGSLRHDFPDRALRRDPDALSGAETELNEYFAGERLEFDVRLDLRRASDFELEVLSETQRIPFGSTVSYGELAGRIGRPGAARAVGNALRHNPVPILVPCHRVVRADGGLGGYGGPSGTPAKERLLALEGVREEMLDI